MTEATAAGFRDVARQAVRDDVVRRAWALFVEHGIEATTVDQIAAAAGMSRRTLFRYFPSKDDLVLARINDRSEWVARALADRPASEPAWTALRRAFDELIQARDGESGPSRAIQRQIQADPTARASVEERRRRWQHRLTPLVARHLADSPDRALQAAAITSSALACLEASFEAWAADENADLAGLVDIAMAAVAPDLTTPV
jgi:AcrR family transcriptional regulator